MTRHPHITINPLLIYIYLYLSTYRHAEVLLLLCQHTLSSHLPSDNTPPLITTNPLLTSISTYVSISQYNHDYRHAEVLLLRRMGGPTMRAVRRPILLGMPIPMHLITELQLDIPINLSRSARYVHTYLCTYLITHLPTYLTLTPSHPLSPLVSALGWVTPAASSLCTPYQSLSLPINTTLSLPINTILLHSPPINLSTLFSPLSISCQRTWMGNPGCFISMHSLSIPLTPYQPHAPPLCLSTLFSPTHHLSIYQHRPPLYQHHVSALGWAIPAASSLCTRKATAPNTRPSSSWPPTMRPRLPKQRD